MTFLKWGLLEAGKFAVLLTFPVCAVFIIADPYNMRRLIESRRYVVYPPSGEKPTLGSKEEINNFIRNREALNKLRDEEEAKKQEGSQ